MERVTLLDVARESGLSTATVSRALNEPKSVTDKARVKVTETITRLGYVPHGVARALALQHTRTVGAIIPTIENSFFAKVITAFQKRLTEQNYSLLLATTEYDFAAEFERVHTFIGKSVDGIMLIGEQRDPAIYDLLNQRKIPFINTFVYNAASPHPSCGFDHAQTIGPSVEYLAGLGHTELGMIIGDISINDRAASRLKVARLTAKRLKMSFREENIVISGYSVSEARSIAKQILRRDNRPTAIVCGNDLLAMGTLFAAQDLGLDVPGELSIFGHGNFDFASELSPPLSTVRLPEYEIGQTAADYLVARMAGNVVPDHIRLASHLEIRGTTAPPPDQIRHLWSED
ncbi:LacI family DNA-binding transcriptional regulator [Puniceibacterium sp. IMCC21224]|uniref:LacI family DNA-binding transcriptional regulator n=1 Tax=Puniceibacterium sp. IMCC21224 TaxID=1618204 RepID=UPI00064DE368|nr:LacI family DNA-binding transcriptional regulator [Puniceibacterium sp. IMCC21224]